MSEPLCFQTRADFRNGYLKIVNHMKGYGCYLAKQKNCQH